MLGKDQLTRKVCNHPLITIPESSETASSDLFMGHRGIELSLSSPIVALEVHAAFSLIINFYNHFVFFFPEHDRKEIDVITVPAPNTLIVSF